MTSWLRAFAVAQVALYSSTAFAQFADGPTEKVEKKPESRSWTVTKDGFSMSYLFVPGIPDPNQVTEIVIVASAVPKTPHPRYGSRVPLENARIALEITNPAGEVVGSFVAHELPLTSGKYGVHFTAQQEGIYSIRLKGKTADGKDIRSDVKLPVAVWPLPKELQGSGDAEGARTARRVIRKPVGK
ncbi:MAG: hypothetical protein RIT81_15005 [Deltaproteobacteria bacterium]